MKKDVVNFAILGYGSIAKNHAMAACHANIFMDLPYKLNLKYIVTRGEKTPPFPGVINTQDLDKVLDDEEIDFISVCTPNDVHFEQLHKIISAKKAVYCEKPITSSYEKSLEISNLAKENKVKMGIGLVNRYKPCVNMLKRAIENGVIGEIIRFKVKYYHKSYLGEGRVGSWKTMASCGKGAVLDLGVHAFDLTNYAIGEIESVNIDEDIYFKERNEVDEISYADVVLKNKAKGSVELSRVYADRKDTNTIEVYGTKGKLKADLNKDFELVLYDFESDYTFVQKAAVEDEFMMYYPNSSMGAFQNSHTAGMVGFINKMLRREYMGEIVPNIEHSLKVEKMIHNK